MAASARPGTDTLMRLIYRSRAIRQPGDPDFGSVLESILRQAWTNNPRHGITGALLFDGIFFLQVIEGASGAVENLYGAIARDIRHESIELIDCLPAEARAYTSFAMAFLDLNDGRFPDLKKVMSRAAQGAGRSLIGLVAEALAAGSSSPGAAPVVCPLASPGTVACDDPRRGESASRCGVAWRRPTERLRLPWR